MRTKKASLTRNIYLNIASLYENYSKIPNIFKLIIYDDSSESPNNLMKQMKYDIKQKFNFILKTLKCSESTFNYVNIKALANSHQRKLYNVFFAREWILYQILINMVILNDTRHQKQIDQIKLGIYGSISPESDIDISFINNYEHIPLHTHTLSYIIRMFEDLFIYFTGYSTLKFNIEAYATFITLNKNITEYFYLDTHTFNIADFEELLPLLGSSILRNLTVNKDSINPNNISITGLSTFNNFINKLSTLDNNTTHSIIASLSKKTWEPKARRIIISYLKRSDSERCSIYYKYVYRLETLVSRIYSNGINHLSNETIKLIIKLYAMSLLYRQESYVLAPTITHVVRILQNNSHINNTRRNCIYPTTIPKCSLGMVGYLCSIMEQIGYMERYTSGKKYKKYELRYNDAINNLLTLI